MRFHCGGGATAAHSAGRGGAAGASSAPTATSAASSKPPTRRALGTFRFGIAFTVLQAVGHAFAEITKLPNLPGQARDLVFRPIGARPYSWRVRNPPSIPMRQKEAKLLADFSHEA